MIISDIRLPHVKNLISGAIPKIDLPYTDVLVTHDNKIICDIRDCILCAIDMGDGPINSSPLGFHYNDLELYDSNAIDLDIDIIKKIEYLSHHYIGSTINLQPVGSLEEAQDNPEYEQFFNRAATDGETMMDIPGNDLYKSYRISVFKGFPNLNKGDRISMYIYPYMGQFTHLIVKYHIYKKKIKQYVDMYFKILNVYYNPSNN